VEEGETIPRSRSHSRSSDSVQLRVSGGGELTASITYVSMAFWEPASKYPCPAPAAWAPHYTSALFA
jgi:hypothetical protein